MDQEAKEAFVIIGASLLMYTLVNQFHMSEHVAGWSLVILGMVYLYKKGGIHFCKLLFSKKSIPFWIIVAILYFLS